MASNEAFLLPLARLLPTPLSHQVQHHHMYPSVVRVTQLEMWNGVQKRQAAVAPPTPMEPLTKV